jgi:hypothetical protein
MSFDEQQKQSKSVKTPTRQSSKSVKTPTRQSSKSVKTPTRQSSKSKIPIIHILKPGIRTIIMKIDK